MITFAYKRVIVGLVTIIILLYFYWTHITNSKSIITKSNFVTATPQLIINNLTKNDVIIACVVCGDRVQETLNMFKSALMFSKVRLHFIVVTEDKLKENFSEKLGEWRSFTNNGFSFTIMPLTFPPENAEEWRKLFKPCAAQRLFLPTVLKNFDSILYVDTDVLFFSPVEDVWRHFKLMNSSQMTALAPEHEDPNVGWYNRFARHPFYGKLGVNSGVMLMNLTRMRAFQWVEYVVPIYKKYKLQITFGDQDIINIIFHYHPDKLYVYPCRYNFRADHCMYMSTCKSAEKYGISVLHGSRGFFHSGKQRAFQAIYRAFEEFQLGGDVYRDFYQPLETYLDLTTNTNCGHIKEVYLKSIKKHIDINEDDIK